MKIFVARIILSVLLASLLQGPLANGARAISLAADNPETKAERDRWMKWWREARFGMFIHWGLYAATRV